MNRTQGVPFSQTHLITLGITSGCVLFTSYSSFNSLQAVCMETKLTLYGAELLSRLSETTYWHQQDSFLLRFIDRCRLILL